MEEDGWKLSMEELPPGGGAHHRGGYCPDEDLRTLEGFMPGPGMPMEQMMHHRMGEFGALRRGNRGSQYMPGGGSEGPPYRGHVARGNGAPFPVGVDKDEMGRPGGDMRSMLDGMTHGLGMQAPNLANSLHNTSLGNYLTAEARAVSASHRQVLVKVVCNYRRTDDLNPGGRPSPPEATNNRCKTILAFQEGNGTHLCFGMFVKEYSELAQVYIDSVDSTPLLEGEHGEDRQKTMTSIVLAYMNHAKLRGFRRLYLRVAPPTDENSFIFTRRLPNVRFRASMHLSLWFKYIVQAASRNGIVHSSKWSTSAVDLEFPTWMLREDDHHAEEAYRAMSASLVQEQQGAKDLVEVANRLQDRFFCVYLHDPMVKTKEIEDCGPIVESEAMRDRMSFAEVCIRQQLRFNVAEASAKSSRVLIAMISAEQQRSPQANPSGQAQQHQQQQLKQEEQQQQAQQQQQQQRQAIKEMQHDEPSGQLAAVDGEDPRQRASMAPGYMDGEQDAMPGGGRGRGGGVTDKERSAAGMAGGRGVKRQPELDMYKDMDGMAGGAGRGMGAMAGGMMQGGGHHPGDVAAFYGYPSHMDSMMSSSYMPSNRMPYGAMHSGYAPEMYPGAMEDIKGAHGKHVAMGMAHMGSHLHPDVQWMGADPRMSGQGMWQHPSASREAMRSMGMPGRYGGRGEGVDPRMLDLHGYGYDPSYLGHIGHSAHIVPSSHEMHMMQGMPGGGMGVPAGWNGMPAMPRKGQGSGNLGPAGRSAAPRSAPSGNVGNSRKRSGAGGGAAPPGGGPGNAPPGAMMPGFGGVDEETANMYADDLQAQEAYEQAGERKRGVARMAAGPEDQGQHEDEEANTSKRKKSELDPKDQAAAKQEVGSPHLSDLKEEPGVLDTDVDAAQALLQTGDEPEFLEADSFLAAPQPGAQ